MTTLDADAQNAKNEIDRQLDERGRFMATEELFMPSWWIGEREFVKSKPYRTALAYMLLHGLIAVERYCRTQELIVFARGEES